MVRLSHKLGFMAACNKNKVNSGTGPGKFEHSCTVNIEVSDNSRLASQISSLYQVTNLCIFDVQPDYETDKRLMECAYI